MEESTVKVSLFGALVGGTIGALVWALIARLSGYEIGFIAWGVGIAVGMGSIMFGGRGDANGVLCALVTVAAIFAGKVLAIHWSLDPEALGVHVMQSWSWRDSIAAAIGDLNVFDAGFAALGIMSALQLGRSMEADVTQGETPQLTAQQP